MAAKDLESSDIKKQKELDEMTTCCICTEVYTDPKALPCLHAFCMKCLRETALKSNKKPGDEMPCPMCRRLFKIPPEGSGGLPKHFFIERLIQVANASVHVSSSRVLCEACLEEHENEAGTEIPVADTYCTDCMQKICSDCCRNHRKTKLTKNHKLIPIEDLEGYLSLTANLPPSVCELHENKSLDVYCADCKAVVCSSCFIGDHQHHKGTHVNNCVDSFRRDIQSNAVTIHECISKAQMKQSEFLQVKEELQQQMDSLAGDIEKRRDEMQQLAHEHANRLLQSLCSLRQTRLKEIQTVTDEIDAYKSHIETYNSYSQRITDKGSASDVCRAFAQLSIRASELQQQCQPIIERRIKNFKIYIRESGLEEFLEEYCDNLIGEIEEDDSKPKKTSKQALLAEHVEEVEILRKELEIEMKKKDDLQSECDQFKILVSQERKTNDSLTDALKREKSSSDVHIKKLEQERDNIEVTNNTHKNNCDKLQKELDTQKDNNTALKGEIDRLKQELDERKIGINTLNDSNDKLKQELDTEISSSRTRQADIDELTQELDEMKIVNDTLEDCNDRLTQEVTLHKATITTLEDKVEKLRQEPEATHAGNMTNDEIKDSVLKIYVKFVSDVDPDLLGDYLKQESVITIDQWTLITEQKHTTKVRCRAVLDFLLSSNHPRAFLVIRKALERYDQYRYILKLIDKEDKTSLPEQRAELPNQQPQSLPIHNPHNPVFSSSPSIP